MSEQSHSYSIQSDSLLDNIPDSVQSASHIISLLKKRIHSHPILANIWINSLQKKIHNLERDIAHAKDVILAMEDNPDIELEQMFTIFYYLINNTDTNST